MENNINLYNDKKIETQGHLGVDIAMQRADDLDQRAIAFATEFSECRVLDAASASGAQAVRMAQAGAYALALDKYDYADALQTCAQAAGVADRCAFVRADLEGLRLQCLLGDFDAIVCQRMIHYVPFDVAVAIVKEFARALVPHGRLFISASGIHSELGQGYAGVGAPLAKRFFPLSDEMVAKHDINGPVCLYSEDDMLALLTAADLKIVKVYSSAFGNIKAEAMK